MSTQNPSQRFALLHTLTTQTPVLFIDSHAPVQFQMSWRPSA
jgi:hypothetical protein